MRSRSATDRLTAVLLGVPVREGAGTHAPAPRSFPRALVETPAYAALLPRTPLTRVFIYRRPLGPHDVLIDILYCGVCHSDIHQARDEWGGSVFPMVPGHEIVGRVGEVGSQVTKFREGEMAGVGCLVDSCRTCEPCRDGFEAFCERGSSFTSNGAERDGRTPTYGGYSTRIVVAEDFALKVPAGLDPAGAAPLLCAGITTYSPLRHWGCHEGDRVAVVGLGGLGHLAVKMAVSMGAEVTVFSTSRSKAADARDLGAQEFELTTGKTSFPKLAGRFHLVIDTVAAPHDYDPYLALLRPRSTLVVLGVSARPASASPLSLILGNKRVAGSNFGGISETQEMLDYCAERGIVSDVEIIPIQKINEAYQRVLAGDVRYRFVIDLKSLQA
jgi:alcohol dehydrogenase (NADP+)